MQEVALYGDNIHDHSGVGVDVAENNPLYRFSWMKRGLR
jgi:hypothetical protein